MGWALSLWAESTCTYSAGGRHIGFLQGADKKEWVWVMGEHKNDKSIEEILEDEAQEKARLLAEQEAEELRSVMRNQQSYKHIAQWNFNARNNSCLHNSTIVKSCP